MSEKTPFVEVGLVVVDGNNLLHRTAGGPGPTAARLLLARLRAALPAGVRAIVVLDGPPDPGGPLREVIAPSLEVRHSGRQSADDVIVAIVDQQSYADRARTIVVTDDRALTERVRHLGGRARRLDWLQAILEPPRRGPRLPPGSGIAPSRPPRPPLAAGAPAPGSEADEEPDRPSWRPGRGATRKRGNPRREPRGR